MSMSDPSQQYTPGYGPQYPAVYAVKPPYLGITIVSMCFGIGALVLGFVPFAGWILGAVAVICGHVGIHQLGKSLQPRSGKGFAIAGLITGYAAIVFTTFWVLFLTSVGNAINDSFAS